MRERLTEFARVGKRGPGIEKRPVRSGQAAVSWRGLGGANRLGAWALGACLDLEIDGLAANQAVEVQR